MIKLQVVAVDRRSSSQIGTIRTTYDEKGIGTPERTHGAEWEEIQLSMVLEEKPTIQIGNISGSAVISQGYIKLIINEPKLFGTYKIGDVIDLIPKEHDAAEHPEGCEVDVTKN